jgi:predicted  nucleic acid-binding Zn-ribbon protein
VIADLDKLIEVQRTDTNLRRLRKLLDSAEARRAAIEKEFDEQASSIREIQGRRDELNARRLEIEKQIADNKKYLERADRNLKHAQNQKEYMAAMHETDSLQKQIATSETQLLETLEAIENVEKELEERREEIETLDGKRAAALKEFDAALAADRAEFAKETAHRAEAFSALPAQLAAVYDRLAQRSRDGIAVAEVINGSCTACNIALRPQAQLEVRKGQQIITCDNCSRILFITPKQTEAVA